jgi:hypothetical protein
LGTLAFLSALFPPACGALAEAESIPFISLGSFRNEKRTTHGSIRHAHVNHRLP